MRWLLGTEVVPGKQWGFTLCVAHISGMPASPTRSCQCAWNARVCWFFYPLDLICVVFFSCFRWESEGSPCYSVWAGSGHPCTWVWKGLWLELAARLWWLGWGWTSCEDHCDVFTRLCGLASGWRSGNREGGRESEETRQSELFLWLKVDVEEEKVVDPRFPVSAIAESSPACPGS